MINLFLGDVAGTEILLILLFVLIFFGPKSIPGLAKTFGRTIRQIKDASDDIKSEITKGTAEITKEIKKDLDGNFDLNKIVKETTQDIEKPFREAAEQVEKSINETESYANSKFDIRPPMPFEEEIIPENQPEENIPNKTE